MATYTVHHRDRDAAHIVARSDDLEFVKEGFAWIAFAVPLVWFIAHGQWLVTVLYLAVLAILAIAFDAVGFSEIVTTCAGIGLNVLIGFEANNLRRWTLRRRGLNIVALTSGPSLHAAELRFLEALVERAGDEGHAPVVAVRPPPEALPMTVKPLRDPGNPAAIFPEPGTAR